MLELYHEPGSAGLGIVFYLSLANDQAGQAVRSKWKVIMRIKEAEMVFVGSDCANCCFMLKQITAVGFTE